VSPAVFTSSHYRLGRSQRLLWGLIFPRRSHKAEISLPGALLILLSMGIGLAAYNSSSNILFITLSLLLSSLILSGLLSWQNLRHVEAELLACSGCRAGVRSFIGASIGKTRGRGPAWGLWCEFAAWPQGLLPSRSSESEHPGSRTSLRQRLSRADSLRSEGRVHLGLQVPPGQSLEAQWEWVPPSRGEWIVSLEGLGSQFPFGFLRKVLSLRKEARVIVRPAPLRVERLQAGGPGGSQGGSSRQVRGDGVDLAGLRRYQEGDSHRLVHWKASARQRQLLVRVNADERRASWCLRLDPFASHWRESDQFEKAVSLAAMLASQLHQEGTLRLLHLVGTPPVRVRTVQDLETWLDLVSCSSASSGTAVHAAETPRLAFLDIVPAGPSGVAAVHHGATYYIA